MQDNSKIDGVKEFLEDFYNTVKKLHIGQLFLDNKEIEIECNSYYARGYIDAVKYIKERIDAILD